MPSWNLDLMKGGKGCSLTTHEREQKKETDCRIRREIEKVNEISEWEFGRSKVNKS